MPTSTPDAEQEETLLVRRELVVGLVMLATAAFFLVNVGAGKELDWLFPRMLAYAVGFMGLCLLGRGVFGFGDKMPVVPLVFRGQGVDVAGFALTTIGYVVLLQYIGFWVSSALMIFAASVYLDTRRSRRDVVVSLIAALAVAIVGYVILSEVFFVFFPEGFLM